MRWTSVNEAMPPCPKQRDALGTRVLIWPRNPGNDPYRGIDGAAYYGRRATGQPEFYFAGAVIHGVTHWMSFPEEPTP
jgi:hypothetical protein